MSLVTNVIISLNVGEDQVLEVIKTLDELCKQNHPKSASFYCLDPSKVGGTKSLESDLFIAAFNYLDEEYFVEFIKELPSKLKSLDYIFFEDMQVFIMKDQDFTWSIYTLSNIDNLLEQ